MISRIIEKFCKERGINPSDLDDPKRKSNVWMTRYMIWHYLHYNHKMSATQLSKKFRRNRPSIFRGIRTIKHEFKYNNALRSQYHDIVSEIEGMTNATPPENME